jgi:TM2 domain-containing membrane protein YozV
MRSRTVVAMLAAFVIPGAGHFYLGKRGRGAAFFAIVVVLFVLGIALDGALYGPATSGGSLIRLGAALASVGAGALYVIANAFGPHGDMTSITVEYGTAFIVTAGLMNLLLVLDAFDIAEGRKP